MKVKGDKSRGGGARRGKNEKLRALSRTLMSTRSDDEKKHTNSLKKSKSVSLESRVPLPLKSRDEHRRMATSKQLDATTRTMGEL